MRKQNGENSILMVISLFVVCLDGCDLASGVVLPHDSWGRSMLTLDVYFKVANCALAFNLESDD